MKPAAILLAIFALSCNANENASILEHPILNAARNGTAKDIETTLRREPNSRDLRTALGSTPLHLAAANAAPNSLKALLAAGADPNLRDKEGLTPLHVAAYSQNATHAQLLLESGADPALKTNAGRDPTSMARKVMANEVAGVISLWLLKQCTAGKPC